MAAINWQDAITNAVATLGVGGSCLLSATWLIRSVISDRLKVNSDTEIERVKNALVKEAEAFKMQIKADADAANERLKNSLQMMALEHQVRFSKLHEERAGKIAELYKRIVEQSVAGQRYVSELGGSTPSEKFFELHRGLVGLDSFYETNRIYFPEHVSGLLARLLSTIKKPVGTAFLYSNTEHVANTIEFREMRQQEIKVALDAFETEVPAARKALEDEFRKMLGVDD